MNELNLIVNKLVVDGKIDPLRLQDFLALMIDNINSNIFSNFSGKKITASITGAKTDYPVSHGLNFIPNFAIIVKQVTNTPVVTFNFNKFTNKDIYITTNGTVSIDVLVGRLDE